MRSGGAWQGKMRKCAVGSALAWQGFTIRARLVRVRYDEMRSGKDY